jgi:glucosamine--fructose-6-phosphate aminotransferase (isomerizing)
MSLMLAEICEQPAVLERTIRAEAEKVSKLGEFLCRRREVDLIVLAARGSSDNACQFGRYLLEIVCGIPVSLAAPSVHTLYAAKINLSRALVIGVSQSGEGVDINRFLESAKETGAFTLGITNEPDSTIVKIADEILLTHAGGEKSVAATKTYTAQMLHFYLLANAMSNAELSIEQIPDFAQRALRHDAAVKNLVERYVFMENCVVVGRGMNYGNTYELALKLMETCYVVAERFSSADFFHGPLAIVERRFPIILFGAAGATKAGTTQLLNRLREVGADVLSITNDAEIAGLSSRSIKMPAEIKEILSPIPFVIPAQLFAAHLATAKGLNPDQPRFLSKVTRTL